MNIEISRTSPPERKYQIFVSSTYTDLKEERDQLIKIILSMGHLPVGMEMFNAADKAQWEIIARTIEESDYYIVILAHRYGSLLGDISFTEAEYDHAYKIGIPIIGFIIDDHAQWPKDRCEEKPQSIKRLNAFKRKVMQYPVDRWSNKDALATKVAISFPKLVRSTPRPGLVRATDAPMHVSRSTKAAAHFLPALPAELRESFTRDAISKAGVTVPSAQPIVDLFTCFYESDCEEPGLVKIQIIRIGGEHPITCDFRLLSTNSTGQMADKWVYRARRKGCGWKITRENALHTVEPPIYRFVDAAPDEFVAVAAIYRKNMVSGAFNQFCTRDSMFVEVKDLAAKRGLNYSFAMGSKKKAVRLIQSAEFWLDMKTNAIEFQERAVSPAALSSLPTSVLDVFSVVAKQAADDFPEHQFRRAFAELASGCLIDDTVEWATDYCSRQARNVVYVTEAYK